MRNFDIIPDALIEDSEKLTWDWEPFNRNVNLKHRERMHSGDFTPTTTTQTTIYILNWDCILPHPSNTSGPSYSGVLHKRT